MAVDQAGKDGIAGKVDDPGTGREPGSTRQDRLDPLAPHQDQLVPPHLAPAPRPPAGRPEWPSAACAATAGDGTDNRERRHGEPRGEPRHATPGHDEK